MGCILQLEKPFINLHYDFEMLMLLAGFAKAETPSSVKLNILENMLERSYMEGNYAEKPGRPYSVRGGRKTFVFTFF